MEKLHGDRSLELDFANLIALSLQISNTRQFTWKFP